MHDILQYLFCCQILIHHIPKKFLDFSPGLTRCRQSRHCKTQFCVIIVQNRWETEQKIDEMMTDLDHLFCHPGFGNDHSGSVFYPSRDIWRHPPINPVLDDRQLDHVENLELPSDMPLQKHGLEGVVDNHNTKSCLFVNSAVPEIEGFDISVYTVVHGSQIG